MTYTITILIIKTIIYIQNIDNLLTISNIILKIDFTQ